MSPSSPEANLGHKHKRGRRGGRRHSNVPARGEGQQERPHSTAQLSLPSTHSMFVIFAIMGVALCVVFFTLGVAFANGTPTFSSFFFGSGGVVSSPSPRSTSSSSKEQEEGHESLPEKLDEEPEEEATQPPSTASQVSQSTHHPVLATPPSPSPSPSPPPPPPPPWAVPGAAPASLDSHASKWHRTLALENWKLEQTILRQLRYPVSSWYRFAEILSNVRPHLGTTTRRAHEQRLFRSGVPSTEEYFSFLGSDLNKGMMDFDEEFVQRYGAAFETLFHTPLSRPLEHWSKPWEFAYIMDVLNALLPELSIRKTRSMEIVGLNVGFSSFPYYLTSQLNTHVQTRVTVADMERNLDMAFGLVNREIPPAKLNTLAVSLLPMRKADRLDALPEQSVDALFLPSFFSFVQKDYSRFLLELHRILRQGTGLFIVTFEVDLMDGPQMGLNKTSDVLELLRSHFAELLYEDLTPSLVDLLTSSNQKVTLRHQMLNSTSQPSPPVHRTFSCHVFQMPHFIGAAPRVLAATRHRPPPDSFSSNEWMMEPETEDMGEEIQDDLSPAEALHKLEIDDAWALFKMALSAPQDFGNCPEAALQSRKLSSGIPTTQMLETFKKSHLYEKALLFATEFVARYQQLSVSITEREGVRHPFEYWTHAWEQGFVFDTLSTLVPWIPLDDTSTLRTIVVAGNATFPSFLYWLGSSIPDVRVAVVDPRPEVGLLINEINYIRARQRTYAANTAERATISVLTSMDTHPPITADAVVLTATPGSTPSAMQIVRSAMSVLRNKRSLLVVCIHWDLSRETGGKSFGLLDGSELLRQLRFTFREILPALRDPRAEEDRWHLRDNQETVSCHAFENSL